MNNIYDKNLLQPITESYVRYGRLKLDELSLKELKTELKRVENELEKIQDEVDESIGVPAYILKERIENINWYKDKIEKEISIKSIKEKKVIKESVSNYKFKKFKNKLTDY